MHKTRDIVRCQKSELSTHLTGRHLSQVIFPFSFKEYLNVGTTTLPEAEIKERFIKYLTGGGFPEPYLHQLDSKNYLKTLFHSIIFKDIIVRHKVRVPGAVEQLAEFLLSNTGSLLSYNTLAKMTGIKSVHSIIKYLSYLEETFLVFQVSRFSFKVREQLKSQKKIYCVDNGLISAKAFALSANTGRLFENLVAAHLKKQKLSGDLEFFYYKSRENYEVDFAVKKGSQATSLIQVCSDLSDIGVRQRKLRGLFHAAKELNCRNLLVLTDDTEETEELKWNGGKYPVSFIPLWKWLLNVEN